MKGGSMMKQKMLIVASTRSHILQFHLPYLRQLQEDGWIIHVACGGSSETIPYTDQVQALPFRKKMTSWRNFQAAGILRKQIKKEQYAAVITHTALAAFFTRLSVFGLRNRPKILHMVHGYLFDDQTAPFRRWLLLTADCITASVTDLLLTMNSYDYHIAKKYHLGKQIHKIPGVGVDFSQLEQQAKRISPQELRHSLGISSDACVLIYPAEFSVRKSQHVLLRSMTLLPKHVVLVLPGTGVCLKQCQRLAKKLGISHRVIFPGYVKDIGAWYAMADVAVASSRSEGLPFSIIEAMHCGLPVVTSSVKGHIDLIQDQHNGLLYSYGDWAQCAHKIGQLINNPQQASTFAENGRDSVRQYNLIHVQPIIMGLYRDTISIPSSQQ